MWGDWCSDNRLAACPRPCRSATKSALRPLHIAPEPCSPAWLPARAQAELPSSVWVSVCHWTWQGLQHLCPSLGSGLNPDSWAESEDGKASGQSPRAGSVTTVFQSVSSSTYTELKPGSPSQDPGSSCAGREQHKRIWATATSGVRKVSRWLLF